MTFTSSRRRNKFGVFSASTGLVSHSKRRINIDILRKVAFEKIVCRKDKDALVQIMDART